LNYEMKRLMMVIHSLRGGGSERVLINLLKGLDRKEFYVTLVLYEREFDFPLPNNVEIKILDIHTGRNIFKIAKSFILKIIRLAQLMRQCKPNVIFSLLSSTNVTVILARLLSRTKCIVFVSEHTHPSSNLKNEVYGGITKSLMTLLYPKADKIIAVSEGIKEDLIKSFHVPEEKITIIYNPVDINEIGMLSQEEADHPWFQDKLPIIVSVGRLTRQKGYPYLIKAFSIVRESLPCRLFIIGEGEDKEKLIQMAKESIYAKDIEFIGFQKNPFKYMAKSSIFVMSSLYEGFGNVLVEAMALGLPVVSTDCPSGPSEIIDNKKNGLLVPVKNEKALAKAILDILKNDTLRNDFRREAKIRAQSFALNKMVEKYRSIFLEHPSSAL